MISGINKNNNTKQKKHQNRSKRK